MYRDYFVTADWLHTHLNDDNLVVLDVSKAPPVSQQIAISYGLSAIFGRTLF